MFAKIRKAVVAGATGGGGAFLTALGTSLAALSELSVESVAAAIGASVAAGIVVGVAAGAATWRVRNEPEASGRHNAADRPHPYRAVD